MGRTSSNKDHALRLLREEVASVIINRLEKKGYKINGPSNFNFNINSDGPLAVVGLYLSPTPPSIMLFVTHPFGQFRYPFMLHNTKSPRRVACNLIQWLKQAKVRQVMEG